MLPISFLAVASLFLPPRPPPMPPSVPVMPRADDTPDAPAPSPPPLPVDIAADLAHFPSYDTSLKIWQQSVRYRDWQRQRRLMGPTAEIIYADEIAAAEWSERAWDLLTYAQAYRHSPDAARDMLRRLRVHLGDDWFERGVMPQAAPDWWREPKMPPEPHVW